MKKHIIKISLSLLASFLLAPTALNIANHNPIAAKAVTVLTTRSSQSYIDNYYSTISNSATGDGLKYSLETLLKAERNSSFSYSNLPSKAFPFTDVDPNRPNEGYIVSFYSGTPVKGYSGMNREHTWPKSHGGNKIDNDPHVIRPTLTSENSARGNQYFGQSPNAGWDPASFNNEKYRGISARIIFYGGVIGASSGLIIEDVARGQDTGTGNRMGKLGDLLKWNLEYPVDVSEIIRNETLDISLDYNRNPFIDDPSLACRIWGDTNASTKAICSQSSSAPETMSLTPSSATINIGNTQTLSVVVTPSEASKNVTWTSTNQAVATVSNGVVTPVSVGVTTITATSTLDNSVKASATITVTNDPIPVSGVSLNKTNVSLSLASMLQLSATVAPSGATNKNVTWESSNANIASVSNKGLVSAKALGTTTITVTTVDGGFKASAKITVTEQPTVTSITGSFYNNVSSNSEGANGVTKDNINKGISSANALGFGGTEVIQTVDASNGYFPRSSGLAIGSTKNNGSLTLTLNPTYHAFKVEARFNSAGIEGTNVTLDGNGTTKSSTSGTIGEVNSNPSTGNYFVVEFNSAVSQITITASKRTALVELIIHYGQEVVEAITPQEEANNWALSFLEMTSDGCSNASFNQLESSWAGLVASFNQLSVEAKSILNSTTPNGEGDAIEEALARYLVIVDKYELVQFITGLIVTGPGQNPFSSDNSISPFTIIGTFTLVGIVISFIVIRRKYKFQ